jgi:uncharacterized protein involved in response to NO
MALAPMLTPLICHGAAPAELAPADAHRQRRWHLFAAALFLASFALQHGLSEQLGASLRGAVVAAQLIVAGKILQSPTVPGLHRRLYRVALWFVPLGELAAGARPAWRVPFLHLTFIGGFSLLVFAVSLHVVFLHTGREPKASGWSRPAFAVGVLTIAAALARATAERFSLHYFEALAIASSLWLIAALVWGLFLGGMLLRRARTQP